MPSHSAKTNGNKWESSFEKELQKAGFEEYKPSKVKTVDDLYNDLNRPQLSYSPQLRWYGDKSKPHYAVLDFVLNIGGELIYNTAKSQIVEGSVSSKIRGDISSFFFYWNYSNFGIAMIYDGKEFFKNIDQDIIKHSEYNVDKKMWFIKDDYSTKIEKIKNYLLLKEDLKDSVI